MNCRLRRLLASLLVLAMFAGFVPSTMFTTVAKAAETGVEKSPIDQSTYEALGFVTDLGTTNESYVTGKSQGKTTMNVKNELFIDLQSHKNSGWIVRDNLNLNHTPTTDYGYMGAYRLYGHYMDSGKYDDLDSKYGWNYGHTVADPDNPYKDTINKNLETDGKHSNIVFETATEYRSSSGKLDRVAKLIVYSGRNRVDWVAYLEIFDATGGKMTRLYGRKLGNAPALDEAGTIYQQYFDALYDIAAGDFDGDGVDEIAVYYGTNTIKIFDTGIGNSISGLNSSDTVTISDSALLVKTKISEKQKSDSEHNGENKVERAAIVSLEAGDLTKDFQAELAVAVSMPQGSTYEAHTNNANAYVFEFNGRSASKKLTVPLKTDDLESNTSSDKKPQVFKASNVAIGDIDGDSCMELVIGGRLCEDSSAGTSHVNWSAGALIAVDVDYSYNKDTEKFDRTYKVGKTHQFTLKNTGGMTNYGTSDDRYTAPAGIAIADFDGSGDRLARIFFFSELFEFQKDNQAQPFVHSEGDNGYLDTITQMRNNVNEKVDKTDHWVSDVVVGNFNNNDAGAEQIIVILGSKEKGSDWYWYYMSYMGYKTETSGNKTVVKDELMRSCEGIVNQGRSYINRNDVGRASTYVAIAAPDVDNDSILLEHIGTQSYYSKPEVQAVLQSAPYFADVAEVYDNYLNNGETTYGTTTSSGEGGTASVEAALGAYTHVEASIGAAAELEVELRATASYEHATVHEVEKSVEYHGGVGDDYVVMYTIPYHRYYYNATFPGSDETEIMFIDQPLTPSTVIVPVSTYDALAETTEGLEPIRGNILTSTPGDPSTYTKTPKGTWTTFQSGLMLTNAGASNSETTASGSMSTTKENSFSIGIEENLNCGFGAGFLGTGGVMGLSQSFAIAGGGTYSNMNGVGFSGTVDNLPEGVGGYAFNWEFGYSETTLNGETVIVVGYKTSNVKQAPSLPKNVSVATVTTDSATLEWGTGSDAAMYEVYVSNDQNEWLPLESVPVTYATADGKIYYTVKGLSSGNGYYFRVNACDSYGIRSLETNPVFARTLSENSSISILSQPEDTTAALGKNATFSVEAFGSGTTNVNYQWFVRKPNYSENGKITGYSGWITISNNSKYSGATSPTLTVTDVVLSDDANQYRCRVSQTANYLYSSDAMLTVSKSPSTTSLALTVDGVNVEGKTIEAASTRVDPIIETVKEWNKVVSNGYNKLSTNETIAEDGSYTYSDTVVWEKDGKYYSDDNGTSEYEVKHVFVRDANNDDDYADANETFKTSTSEITVDETIKTEDNTALTASSRYLIDGDKYIYVVTTTTGTDDAAETTTAYYAPVSTVTVGEGESATTEYRYAEVFVSDDIITIGTEDHSVSQLVNVKASTDKEITVGYETVESNGQTLSLSAEIKDGTNSISSTTGSVVFYLKNAATGVTTTVNGTKGADGKWTATYVFEAPGVYTVSANYNGDETYFSSRSDAKPLYVTTAVASLNISGGTMTYGGNFDLNPVIMNGTSQSSASNVTYGVKKGTQAVTSVINGNIFTPDSAGVYTITATATEDGTTLTTSSVITVNKKTATITAPVVEANVTDSNERRIAIINTKGATVSGISLSSDAYTFDCEATKGNIQAKGDYAIDVVLTKATEDAYSDKYNFVLMPGTLTLEQGKANVKAEAYANGSVRISYTTTIDDSNGTYTSSPLTVESGTMLPVGAKVTVTAIPASGFGVDKWVVDGTNNESAGTATEYSFILGENGADIDVYFALTYATLNFNAQTGGTIAGTYKGGNTVFNNGDSINASQNVVLTATPNDGFVVSHWTKNGEIIPSANGVGNYTGETLTVSGVAETTTYSVYFAQKETAKVTVKFIHKLASGQEDVLGCGVTVNGTELDSTTNTFVYETYKHDNVTISIDIPENMLVDYWSKDDKVVANAVEEFSVYDIAGDLTYIVYCETPNQREVVFNAEIVTDKTNGVLADAGTITAERNGTAITSGYKLPQGSVVNFTATPAAGYRINKWTINGLTYSAVNSVTVSDNTTVKVYFEKLPVVTITETADHGTANGFVGGNAIGSFVQFGDDVQVDVTPEKGYVVDTVKVNGSAVSLTTPSGEATDKRYVVIDDVEKDTAVEVSYKLKPVVTLDNGAEGTVEMTAVKDFINGTITSGSYVDFGSDVVLTVDPADGYVVDTVSLGTIATIENSDNVTVTVAGVQADTTVKVTYKAKPVITINSNENGTVTLTATKDFTDGTVANGSYVDFGSDVVVTIESNFGYVVEKFTSGATIVVDTDAVAFTISNAQADKTVDVTYRALDTTPVTFGIIDKAPESEGGLDGTITASVNRKDMDSYKVENADTLTDVYEGSTVTFTATPATGYKVSKWFVNGVEVATSPVLTIAKDMADQNVMVQFDLIGKSIDFSIESEETEATLSATFTPDGGTAQSFESGNRPAANGKVAVTAADIADGYEIEGWYVDGVKVEGETGTTYNYAATVDVGAQIVVKIIRSSYKVEYSAVNGTVTTSIASGDMVKGDTEVTFTATPVENTGYAFKGWTVNGTKSDVTDETLTLAITANTTVKAEYELVETKYTVTYGVIGENGTLALAGFNKSPASVKAGSDLTFTATPAADYRVKGWYSDAAGTTAIEGTTFEQNSYNTTNLIADMTVYVEFEQIPRYEIDVTVTGLGSVTATVNGVAAEIAEGKLTVKRYDDVVLTATPDEYQFFAGWTVGETSMGNASTLTFTDVVENATVKAEFAPSQNIELKTIINTNEGSIKVQAGYNESDAVINPTTGIIINRGQKVVLTVTPDSDKMVKSWKIDGVEMVDYLAHEYVIENILKDTVVEVEFEDLKLFDLPAGTDAYDVTNITETPVDLGGTDKVRDRGNVTFTVAPKNSNAITALAPTAGEGARIETTKNADGTWTVTIENVKGNVVLNPTVVPGKSLTINCGEGGTVSVKLGENEVTSGYVFMLNDKLTVKATANSGFAIDTIKLNGADFTNNSSYTVKAEDNAIVIDVTFKAAPAGGGGGGFGGGGGGGSSTYPPVVEEDEHGKLIVTPENPSKGDTVVITPVPDPGYMLDEIIVTDKNGNEIETEFNRDGTYTFEQPSGVVTIDGEFKKIVLPFEDVPTTSYYAEAVLWAVENGITTGTTATTFSPDMACTRAQAVTFLWRAAGSPAPKSTVMPFADVAEGVYYYDAVLWAVENGITTGTGDGSVFSPDMICSRGQIVTLLARLEKAEKSDAENPFTDVTEGAYYHDAVLWAVENYITKGTTDTTFTPDKDCTRAEIVTFLWRCFR